jgi:hypothetical protein
VATVSISQARAAKARALALFADVAEVAGIGLTQVENGYGLKVNLRAPPRPGVTLPDTVDGVPVRIEVVGPINAR